LKQEKRINWRQTTNGAHFGMTQRKDSELELVTGGQGSPILFWDCDEKAPVAQIPYPYKVTSLMVSPSGRFLAFGTETHEVFVYALEGQNNFTFVGKGLGHSAPVSKICWSPDEKQLVSVSADCSISIWNFFGSS
jgi:WD40 repeat protein